MTVSPSGGPDRCGASASGAPRTYSPRRVRRALQRRDDENGISSSTAQASPGSAAARAVLVRLWVVALRAIEPTSRSASPSAVPRGSSSVSVRRPVVSVPVLSVHTTSTLLTDSTALTRWTRAPCAAVLAAPTV